MIDSIAGQEDGDERREHHRKHHHHQKHFYHHLKMHPSYYKAAQRAAKKLVAKDPTAIAELKSLAMKVKEDPSAANAMRAIAVVTKFEFADFYKEHHAKGDKAGTSMVAGALPGMAAGGIARILKLALAPAAWVLSTGGKAFHFAGSQLQHLAHFI